MKTFPLVSIIIPVYKGYPYLDEAIQAALNQTYKNVEVIVINDGSPDNGKTRNIAQKYEDRIRYYEKENGGVSSALNLGISLMKGEWFSWLSHDDLYSPQKIQHQIEAISTFDDDHLIALSGSNFIDSKGNVIGNAKSRFAPNCKIQWEEALKSLLIKGSFNGCALLIPKKIFNEVGTFNEDLRFTQDLWMWYNIFLNRYSLVYTSYIDTSNRIHNGQITCKAQNLYLKESEHIGNLLIPILKELSNDRYRFLYWLALKSAKYGINENFKRCIKVGNFSIRQFLKIKVLSYYSNIRPYIREIYYTFRAKL